MELILKVKDKFSMEFTHQYILDTELKISKLVECSIAFWDSYTIEMNGNKTTINISTNWVCNLLRWMKMLPKLNLIEIEINKRKPVGSRFMVIIK